MATAQRFAINKRRFAPNDTVFDVGQRAPRANFVLSGSIIVTRHDGLGGSVPFATFDVGGFTGEISQLTGRPSLAEGRAGPQGCEALEFDAEALQALLVGSAELGEVVMRAFILRRVALIEEGVGLVLLGHSQAPDVVKLRNFLSRNGHPYQMLDPATDHDAAGLPERFGLSESDLPVAVCPNGTVLRNPSISSLARCLGYGLPDEATLAHTYDVVVVGAGPAGLASAVYAASEGLSVLVMDSCSYGGQAGASARIENYLGFPTGISGQALAGRAFVQAQKFGAQMAIPADVASLDCSLDCGPTASNNQGTPLSIALADGQRVRARAVVIASGARYRRPEIPDLARYEELGAVHYWASSIEAKLCQGEEVVLIGGGNSAGQAAVFLSNHVGRLNVLIRGPDVAANMSRYLIDRIAAAPNINVLTNTEVVGLGGADQGNGLNSVRWRNRRTGDEEQRDIHRMFLFTGADPATGWLANCGVALDKKGFVVTGNALGKTDLAAKAWERLARQPQPLETSYPGVFAIGDVRAGSTKRVAAAVGEGAAVVAQIHTYLA
jgi:thioredoxin reductase (NADPH)